MTEFVFPAMGEHEAILGCNGSGKTQYAFWKISEAPFHQYPWFILDYKGEEMSYAIDRARIIDLRDSIPSEPGLYVIHARPDEGPDVEKWFEKLWNHENAGLYIDEGYLAPDKAWLQNLLAQGRSKKISVTISSQRPFFVPRSVFTEASYLTVFRLNDDDDKARVRAFSPPDMTPKGVDTRLPDFHSWWYSVKHHRVTDPFPYLMLRPVPGANEIIEKINSRLKPRQRLI